MLSQQNLLKFLAMCCVELYLVLHDGKAKEIQMKWVRIPLHLAPSSGGVIN
jgi:hypothetical protein